MNINEMIEQEIQKQVEERIATFKAELQAEYDKKLADTKSAYKNLLKSKILRIFDEEEIVAQKCNYPDCKNYGDGSVDDICAKCDSYKIKKDKDTKCEANLAASAAAKSAVKKAVDKIFNKTEKPAKTEETKPTEESVDKSDKLFKETVEAISPFFDLLGITKDEIYAAREKMHNDPKVKEEAERLAKELGLDLI